MKHDGSHWPVTAGDTLTAKSLLTTVTKVNDARPPLHPVGSITHCFADGFHNRTKTGCLLTIELESAFNQIDS